MDDTRRLIPRVKYLARVKVIKTRTQATRLNIYGQENVK